MMRTLFAFFAILLMNSSFCRAATTYSSVVTAGDFVFVSGQVPIDPNTGKMIDGDIETLTNQVLDNIQHLLQVKGVTMKRVVKTQVFLKDIRDYDAMDKVYGKWFNFQYPPARDVIAAPDLLYNARIEISCIAYKKRV